MLKHYETGSLAVKICERSGKKYPEAIELIKRHLSEENEKNLHENMMTHTDVADWILLRSEYEPHRL